MTFHNYYCPPDPWPRPWPMRWPWPQDTGWTCPKCGRVYSPQTPGCWSCNMSPQPPSAGPIATTDNTSGKEPKP